MKKLNNREKDFRKNQSVFISEMFVKIRIFKSECLEEIRMFGRNRNVWGIIRMFLKTRIWGKAECFEETRFLKSECLLKSERLESMFLKIRKNQTSDNNE